MTEIIFSGIVQIYPTWQFPPRKLGLNESELHSMPLDVFTNSFAEVGPLENVPERQNNHSSVLCYRRVNHVPAALSVELIGTGKVRHEKGYVVVVNQAVLRPRKADCSG